MQYKYKINKHEWLDWWIDPPWDFAEEVKKGLMTEGSYEVKLIDLFVGYPGYITRSLVTDDTKEEFDRIKNYQDNNNTNSEIRIIKEDIENLSIQGDCIVVEGFIK